MKRREFTGLMAVITLSGCSTLEGGLEREAYEVGNTEELLPDRVGSDWPDQDLEPNHELNDNFKRVWATPDQSLAILMDAEIFESVSAAQNAFEKNTAAVRDPREYPMADEAAISDDGESARCIFRHSNAIGLVLALRQSGLQTQPDRQRATTYAELMFMDWQ